MKISIKMKTGLQYLLR